MGFGERMRREREMRGIALDEIVNATKIGSRTLRALEDEDFSKLPGGIFNKGFVRAYARYLGIDEEQAVADYLTALGESGEADSEHVGRKENSWKPAQRESRSPDFSALPIKPLALLLLIVVGLFLVWHVRHSAVDHLRQWGSHLHRHHAPSQTVPAAPVHPAAVTQVSSVPSTTSSSAPPQISPVVPAAMPGPPPVASPVAAAVPSPAADTRNSGDASAVEFVLLLHAREDSWVNITADGTQVMKGTLIARRDTTVRAKHKITLVAGNAAAIEYSFNGKPQGALGDKTNEVRSVIFTASGLQP